MVKPMNPAGVNLPSQPQVLPPPPPPPIPNEREFRGGPAGLGGLGNIGGVPGARNNFGTSTNIGGLGLPSVSDPDKAYASITRGEYLDFVNQYGDFERDLINQAQTDTSLIEQARDDAALGQTLARDMSQRNLSRYGANLTPVQQRELERTLQRQSTLGGIQSVQDARIAQEEANTKLMADLINIGQGVNRTSQQQLGQSAANKTQLDNAYRQAKASAKAQNIGAIGQIGSMAIMMMAGL